MIEFVVSCRCNYMPFFQSLWVARLIKFQFIYTYYGDGLPHSGFVFAVLVNIENGRPALFKNNFGDFWKLFL